MEVQENASLERFQMQVWSMTISSFMIFLDIIGTIPWFGFCKSIHL